MAKSKHFPGKDVYIHVLCHHRRLTYGDRRWVRKNRWMRARGPYGSQFFEPRHCAPGMHACTSGRGVFAWGNPNLKKYVCVVELRGKVSRSREGKIVAEERRVLALRRINLAEEYCHIISFTHLQQYIDWVMENPS